MRHAPRDGDICHLAAWRVTRHGGEIVLDLTLHHDRAVRLRIRDGHIAGSALPSGLARWLAAEAAAKGRSDG